MDDATITIRRSDRGDWRALKAIRLEALVDTPDAYGSTWKENSTWSDAQWKNAASNRLYYLAFRDDIVVGMVSGGLNDMHPGTRWLYGMYVTPSDRGTGTADELVATVCAWVRSEGFGEVYLHVTSTVARARAFYTRLGFRPTGERFAMDRDRALTLETMVLDLD
jgi:GNAT superfamily N-acetyltransferase